MDDRLRMGSWRRRRVLGDRFHSRSLGRGLSENLLLRFFARRSGPKQSQDNRGGSLLFRKPVTHTPAVIGPVDPSTTPSFRTEQADAFSFHSAPAEWSACEERNLSSLFTSLLLLLKREPQHRTQLGGRHAPPPSRSETPGHRQEKSQSPAGRLIYGRIAVRRAAGNFLSLSARPH